MGVYFDAHTLTNSFVINDVIEVNVEVGVEVVWGS